ICMDEKDLQWGRKVHDIISQSSDNKLKSNEKLQSMLMSMYIKCGDVEEAEKIFLQIKDQNKNIVDYNSIMKCYNNNNLYEKTIKLYQKNDIQPDHVTYILVLQACRDSQMLEDGKSVHFDISQDPLYRTHREIYNLLLDMYLKLNDLKSAEEIFIQMRNQNNVISFTSMMKAYNKENYFDHTLQLYKQMIVDKVKPDHTVYQYLLQACADGNFLDKGTLFHTELIQNYPAFLERIEIQNSLLNMYGKCKQVKKCEQLFNRIPLDKRDIITYCTMITVYDLNDQGKNALQLFEQMKRYFSPTHDVYVLILNTCLHHKFVQEAKQIFNSITDKKHKNNAQIITIMIEIFACSNLWFDAELFIINYELENGTEKLDHSMYCTLLSIACLTHSIEQARNLFKRLKYMRTLTQLDLTIYQGLMKDDERALLEDERDKIRKQKTMY
ncbi:unnamed protein product, partial [Didymodactylos carnosus]